MSSLIARAVAAVAAVACFCGAPAPAFGHGSEYCEHSYVNGQYWQVDYWGYRNEHYNERNYHHFHSVLHSYYSDGSYEPRHQPDHFCGEGTVKQGEVGQDVQVDVPVPSDVGGNVPEPADIPEMICPGCSGERTTDALSLAEDLRAAGHDVRYISVNPSLGISSFLDAPGPEQCAVGVYARDEGGAVIEIAGPAVAEAIGHDCDRPLVR